MNFVSWVRAQWDRSLAVTCFGLGGVFLLVGWSRVSQEALTAAQVPYIISGGLGGLFLLGLGAVFWLSADLRDEWRKLDEIEIELAARPGNTRQAPVDAPGHDADVAAPEPPHVDDRRSSRNGSAAAGRPKRPVRGVAR